MFSQLTDSELTEKIKNNQEVSGCLTELQHRHSGIFFQKTNKYKSVREVRELQENPLTFFYDVASSYDETRSKFSSWLGQKASWTCIKYLKDKKEEVEMQDNMVSENPKFLKIDIHEYIRSNIENEEDRRILTLSLEGYTLKEIAEKLDGKYTSEWIRVKKDRIVSRFKSILEKEL